MRKVRQYDWWLPECNEAALFALPEDDRLDQDGAPQPHVQQQPSKRKQNRINKLAAALDEYDAALEALMVELGRHEAHDLLDKAWEPIEEIVDRMNAIEPTTVAGLQAKAKLLLEWYWHNGGDDEDPMTVEIIKGLAGARLAA